MVFGAATSDRATALTSSRLDNLATWTLMIHCHPTTLTNSRSILNKGIGGSNNRRVNLIVSGTAGRISTTLDRATSDMNYVSNAGGLTAGQDCFVAAVCDNAGASGLLTTFYAGMQELVDLGRITATDGSGAFQSDSGVALTLANTTTGSPTAAFQGTIYAVALSGALLTPDEIAGWRDQPFTAPRDIRGLWYPGLEGSQVVFDHAGAAHATVTGGVLDGRELVFPEREPVNVARWKRALFPPSGGSFLAAWARGMNTVLQPGVIRW